MFKERPIISESLIHLRPSEQYTPYTSNFSKTIGGILNISPKALDHLLSGYSGGLALDIIKGLPSEIKQPADIPIAGRLFTRKSTYGMNGETVSEFYDAYNRATSLYLTVTRSAKAGKIYKMSDEDKKFFNNYKSLRKAAGNLKSLRDYQRTIEKQKIDKGTKEQIIAAINQGAYIVAQKATDFLRSKKEKKQRGDLSIPKILLKWLY